MDVTESLRVATRGVIDNKGRSLLTMLGIIIGVGAVITMISIGQGAQSSITNTIQGLGTNLLTVSPGQSRSPFGALRGGFGSADTLTMDDVESIEEIEGVEGVALERRDSNAPVKYGSNNTTTQITGTTPDYEEIRNFHVAEGRFITEADVKSRRKVAVIGKTVLDVLFPNEDPLGRKIKIRSDSYNVIGVMEEKGQSGFSNPDDTIFVAASILERQSKPISTISVQAASEDMMDLVQERIGITLRSNHRLKAGEEDDFGIGNQAEIMATLSSVTSTFTILLGGVAAISLLVGGIGIMNIMLVTVTERTKEIGIRKAIGANRYDVMWQFLIESTVVSLIGGAIGILFGMGASYLVSEIGGWGTAVTLGSVLLAFGFSAAIGIFFGFYPAQRAARLDPIVALRYE